MGDAHYLSSQEGGAAPCPLAFPANPACENCRTNCCTAPWLLRRLCLPPLFAASVCHLCLSPLFARAPGRPRSLGTAVKREGVWPLSHLTPPLLSQSCHSLATPAFPLPGEGGGGGLGSPLSFRAFAASPLWVCHWRKSPSMRASAPEPFTFSIFATQTTQHEYFTLVSKAFGSVISHTVL